MRRLYFEARSTADLNDHQAWIIYTEKRGRIIRFALAEGIAKKVHVDSLTVGNWEQLAAVAVPGVVFEPPQGIHFSFLCRENECVKLQIDRRDNFLAFEDCQPFDAPDHKGWAIGWIEVEEARA